MKHFFIVLLTLLFLSPLESKELSQKPFLWENGWRFPVTQDLIKGKELAKVYDKPLLLFFTEDNTTLSNKLFSIEVLQNPLFCHYVKRSFISVGIDCARDDTLKKRFSITSFPTLIVLDSKGEEMGRVVGYLSQGVGAYIAKIKEKHSPFALN